MTAGNAGVVTDHLNEARYLGTLARVDDATTIRIARTSAVNPLRPADVRIVVAGFEGNPEPVVSNVNSATLRMLGVTDCPNTTGRATACCLVPPAEPLLSMANGGAQCRIITGEAIIANDDTAATQRTNANEVKYSPRGDAGYKRTVAETLTWVRNLVHDAYATDTVVPLRADQDNTVVDSHVVLPTRPVARAQVTNAGFHKTRGSSRPPIRPGKPLLRPLSSNYDIFAVEDFADAGTVIIERPEGGYVTPNSRNICESADDNCWYFDDYDCVRCAPEALGRTQTFRGCADQLLVKPLQKAVAPLIEDNEARIGGSGIPAHGISYRRPARQLSLTESTAFRSILAAGTAIYEGLKPLVRWFDASEIRSRLEKAGERIKSAIWPWPLGHYFGGEIFL